MAPASKKFKRDAPKLAVGEGPLYKLFKPRFSGEPEKLAAEIQRAAIVEHTASLREEKADGELRALAQAKAAAAGEQVHTLLPTAGMLYRWRSHGPFSARLSASKPNEVTRITLSPSF